MSPVPEHKPGAMEIHQSHGLAVFRPQTLAEAVELAGHLAKSTLVPKDYQGRPENVLVAMTLGAEIGLSPFQALQSIAVINGRPGVYGDAGLGIVMASGLLEDMDETDEAQTQTATCWMKRKGGRRVERSFSHADAQQVTMYERDGQGQLKQTKLADRAMWRSFPKRMRQMRARWWVMKDLFPDVLKGLVGREEHEADASPIPPTDVTPEAEFADLMPREKGVEDATATAPPVVLDAGGAVIAPPVDTSVQTSAPPAADVRVEPEEEPRDPKRSFDINGRNYQTEGITRDQLLQTFALSARVDKLKKNQAKQILLDEFKVQTRQDLTEETGEQYIIRLKEVLGEV